MIRRAAPAQALPPPKRKYLYFVGCAGAYDDRNKKVSRAFVEILNAAGVDFAVLRREERCNGECAPRIGNEYLAEPREVVFAATCKTSKEGTRIREQSF